MCATDCDLSGSGCCRFMFFSQGTDIGEIEMYIGDGSRRVRERELAKGRSPTEKHLIEREVVDCYLPCET